MWIAAVCLVRFMFWYLFMLEFVSDVPVVCWYQVENLLRQCIGRLIRYKV
jgi:hypothetical protein